MGGTPARGRGAQSGEASFRLNVMRRFPLALLAALRDDSSTPLALIAGLRMT